MNKERFFKIKKVTKPGQKEAFTKLNDNMILTGKPNEAAKKAMTRLCKMKNIKGICALRIELVELVPNPSFSSPKTTNGNVVQKTKKNENGKIVPKIYTYRLQRRVQPTTVNRNGKSVTFKYITKSAAVLNKKKT